MSASQVLPSYAKYEYFLVTAPSEYVAHVEINRPKKLNAFSEPVWREYGRLFSQLSDDKDVRAVVLSAAGDRAFSAGLDVQSASQEPAFAPDGLDVARKAKPLRATIGDFQDAVSASELCDKPVICVLHGISYGLSIDLASATDIRICSADTRFSVKEVDIGMAADVGTLSRLPKVVGSTSWVKDVCMSAREFGAQEALQVGFVSQVHESKGKAVQAGLELAALIASKSPLAVQGTKELLNHARDHTTADSLRYTAVWNSAALQSEDFSKGLMSAMKRQKPKFAKL